MILTHTHSHTQTDTRTYAHIQTRIHAHAHTSDLEMCKAIIFTYYGSECTKNDSPKFFCNYRATPFKLFWNRIPRLSQNKIVSYT